METDPVRRSVAWVNHGVWGILARWFRVPADPPTLPSLGGAAPVSMRPANGYLSYQRTLFVLAWAGPLFGAAMALTAINLALPMAGTLISVPIVLVIAFLALASWIGIHLRF